MACGHHHFELKEFEIALTYFIQIKGPKAYFFTGKTFHEMGNNKEATVQFLKVVKTKNKYSRAALNELGVLCESENKLPEAIKHFEEAANGDAYGNLARIYEQQGKTEKALEYYTKGKDIGDEDCAYNLGIFLINQRKKEKKGQPKTEWYSLDLLLLL